jgi:hypothetical protein
MIHDWSDEETDNPRLADEYNFYKVEKWTEDGSKVNRLLYAGDNVERARQVFANAIQFHRAWPILPDEDSAGYESADADLMGFSGRPGMSAAVSARSKWRFGSGPSRCTFDANVLRESKKEPRSPQDRGSAFASTGTGAAVPH